MPSAGITDLAGIVPARALSTATMANFRQTLAFCLHLQYRRGAAGRRSALSSCRPYAFADLRRGGDRRVLGQRDRRCAPTKARQVLASSHRRCGKSRGGTELCRGAVNPPLGPRSDFRPVQRLAEGPYLPWWPARTLGSGRSVLRGMAGPNPAWRLKGDEGAIFREIHRGARRPQTGRPISRLCRHRSGARQLPDGTAFR
jgi:hypothetical protein